MSLLGNLLGGVGNTFGSVGNAVGGIGNLVGGETEVPANNAAEGDDAGDDTNNNAGNDANVKVPENGGLLNRAPATSAAPQTTLVTRPSPIPVTQEEQESEEQESANTDVVTPPVGGDIPEPTPSVPSLPASDGGSSMPPNLIPIVGASAGGLLLIIIIAIIMTTRYRRRRWPFAKRESFARLDDEVETIQTSTSGSKWDPSRVGPGASRISRFMANRSG
ncbi:unnamed protein product [Parascedosporium putredinis]|uniref:Uncharacterized protein n=1 Tax=Parascedosporium putredinis TaxID=1442378 RepID=A0A9P1HCF7_9PEZI|nr:unnamed protein product [Parascedosporium putredinis]CAI8004848.1 unnamed protein product [Parascedosporium putredinis]